MATRFYNTLAHEVQAFVPLSPGRDSATPLAGAVVKMYTCGPTVYDFAHIGNFRAFLFADVLRRYLEFRGAKVHQVMNMTDVGHMVDDSVADAQGQDKMEKAVEKLKEAKKSGKASVENPNDPYAVAQYFVDRFLEDARALQVKIVLDRDAAAESERDKLMPRPTRFIGPFIRMIQTLIEKGHAYVGSDGVVYYSVASFPAYGRLSGNSIEQLAHGAGGRTTEGAAKRHPADFFLWKPDPRHLMRWPSPWGEGYPGWHIECSAMATTELGDSIDIHTGGEDNIFPHHECEIAQSEGATGKPFSHFWMHTRHLMVDGTKMSKSKGNFFTIRDLVTKGFDPLAIRFALISARYRETLNFTLQGLHEAARGVTTLRDLAEKLSSQLPGGSGQGSGADGGFRNKVSCCRRTRKWWRSLRGRWMMTSIWRGARGGLHMGGGFGQAEEAGGNGRRVGAGGFAESGSCIGCCIYAVAAAGSRVGGQGGVAHGRASKRTCGEKLGQVGRAAGATHPIGCGSEGWPDGIDLRPRLAPAT